MDAIAAGLGAEIDDGTAHARRLGVENRIGARDAHRHGVDEDIAVIARVEIHGAADGRHPEGIAIAADARHHAGHQMAGARMIGRAEAQQIEAGDGARAHGEDIAQNAADPGGRALIGLDIGGVVVALHLEDAGQPVANVDDASVLARPLNDPGRLGGQFAQVQARALVGAMLVPHGREDAQLRDGRLAADQGQDALIFIRLEAMFGDQRRGDLGFVAQQGGGPLVWDVQLRPMRLKPRG